MTERPNKTNCKPILIRIPKRWMPAIEEATNSLDLDRSKFIRHAIREKLSRLGVAEASLN